MKNTISLPTPHLAKLNALRTNPRLPSSDKGRVNEAIKMYQQWIVDLETIPLGKTETISKLVDATNRYKRFIELDLIFNSSKDFLYRQKGQLKLDNTILEEFLPQLLHRSLRGLDENYALGPAKTFSGLSFTSTIGHTGTGGTPQIRVKDQDFILGKPLYIKTSFDSGFSIFDSVESHLGYVCAECKTNLDKTMFQEAVATSRDLKMAVPNSLYFLICEFLDMTPVSIISTQIDDVLIVRKAKRMSSNIRQEYKNAVARRQRRDEYAAFLDASQYSAEVFTRMIDKVQRLIDETDPNIDTVLKHGHF